MKATKEPDTLSPLLPLCLMSDVVSTAEPGPHELAQFGTSELREPSTLDMSLGREMK